MNKPQAILDSSNDFSFLLFGLGMLVGLVCWILISRGWNRAYEKHQSKQTYNPNAQHENIGRRYGPKD